MSEINAVPELAYEHELRYLFDLYRDVDARNFNTLKYATFGIFGVLSFMIAQPFSSYISVNAAMLVLLLACGGGYSVNLLRFLHLSAMTDAFSKKYAVNLACKPVVKNIITHGDEYVLIWLGLGGCLMFIWVLHGILWFFDKSPFIVIAT